MLFSNSSRIWFLGKIYIQYVACFLMAFRIHSLYLKYNEFDPEDPFGKVEGIAPLVAMELFGLPPLATNFFLPLYFM